MSFRTQFGITEPRDSTRKPAPSENPLKTQKTQKSKIPKPQTPEFRTGSKRAVSVSNPFHFHSAFHLHYSITHRAHKKIAIS